jgi:hypothetical protein
MRVILILSYEPVVFVFTLWMHKSLKGCIVSTYFTELSYTGYTFLEFLTAFSKITFFLYVDTYKKSPDERAFFVPLKFYLIIQSSFND